MFCAHCGTRSSPLDTKCSSCGRKLPDATREVATGVLTPPPDVTSVEGTPDLTRLLDASDDEQATRMAPLSGPRDQDAPPVIPVPESADATRLADVGPPPGAERAYDPDATRLAGGFDTGAAAVGPNLRRKTTGVGSGAAGRRAGRSLPSGPLEVGQAFGTRYHIIRELGVGGMGAVYQAWDAELGVAVAVKVIRPEILAADPQAAHEIERRFKRELLLARQVTHKNVVRIHDLGEIDGIKYITMPYLDGSDLATILKTETKLPLPRALRITRGIVSGLIPAHEAGVVHRDLKPANIMVSPEDEPTIMDFGIARSSGGPVKGSRASVDVEISQLNRSSALMAGSTMAGSIIGTVEYMAPEQARAQPVDQRADIYAVGLILYDLLIGRHRSEHAESAIAELQGRILQAPPPSRTVDPTIPAPIDAIITRCLEPDPDKRFQTTLELQAALDRLDENGKPLPIIRRLTRWTMAAAAVVIVLLLGGTFYVTKWLSAPVKEPDPVSLVIADVQNKTGDATFDNAIAQTLRRALEDASFISAYDRSKLPNLGVTRVPEKLDEVAARELAVKQGVGVVLAGSIAPYRDGYEISVRAMQAVTGNEIVNTSGRASNKDGVLEATAKLMARVRKVLGDRTSESDQLFAMRSVSASSLDVVSQYAAGQEATARGKWEEARQKFSRAVELDPNFALGYQGLSATAATLGQPDEAKKQIQEALRHVDGMTARERFFTRGAYLQVDARLAQLRQRIRRVADPVSGRQHRTRSALGLFGISAANPRSSGRESASGESAAESCGVPHQLGSHRIPRGRIPAGRGRSQGDRATRCAHPARAGL